jgi:hypothetical protein
MGDMADLYDECYDYREDGGPEEWFAYGPERLVEYTKYSRDPKVISIRTQYIDTGKMSKKQQWVLAYYLYERC